MAATVTAVMAVVELPYLTIDYNSLGAKKLYAGGKHQCPVITEVATINGMNAHIFSFTGVLPRFTTGVLIWQIFYPEDDKLRLCVPWRSD